MPLTITAAQLRAIAGAKAPRVEEIAGAFNDLAPRFGLDQEKRAEQFLAQIAHESGAFRYVREIWGPTQAQRGYEGRRDLGNTQRGDGKRFMGHGLLQITGRDNHHAFTAWARANGYPEAPDFEAEPQALERFPWALLAAVWYWHTRGLNALADRGDVLGITKRINGGTNGLTDRKLRLALAEKAITAGTPTPLAPVPSKDATGRKTLRKGSKGADVYKLQKALAIDSDGVFGKGTEAALIAFQKTHGLLPDGICGPASWAALDDPKPAPAPTVAAEPEPLVIATPAVTEPTAVVLMPAKEGEPHDETLREWWNRVVEKRAERGVA